MKRDNYIAGSRKITCREANAMIPAYLNGKLNDRDLCAFINHIENCNRCYEELETNFMVEQTVKYLNAEENGSFNLKPLLQKDLCAKKEAFWKARRAKIVRKIIIAITLLLLILLILDLTGIFRITLFARLAGQLLGFA